MGTKGEGTQYAQDYQPALAVMSANQLAPVIISGNVTVSLAELDKLRAEHAKAIQIAQKLESQQKKVVVKVTGMQYHTENRYIRNDRNGYPVYETQSSQQEVIRSMEVWNLEDTMTMLTDKVTLEVADAHAAEISLLKAQNKEMSDNLIIYTKRAEDRYVGIQKLDEQIRIAKKQYSEQTDELDTANKRIKELERAEKTKWIPMQNLYTDLVNRYNKLHTAKTFWGWLVGTNKED